MKEPLIRTLIKEALKEHSFISEVIGGFFLIPYIYFSSIDSLFKIIILTTFFLNSSLASLSDSRDSRIASEPTLAAAPNAVPNTDDNSAITLLLLVVVLVVLL